MTRPGVLGSENAVPHNNGEGRSRTGTKQAATHGRWTPIADDETSPPEPPIDDGPELVGRQVAHGAMWSALNAAVLRVATFAVSLAVAHLVVPYDFGVFTVALTVYTVAVTITDIGVGAALVREPTRSKELAPTVFTIAVCNGALLTLIMLIFAPELATALGAPSAAAPIRVLSLVVLLGGLTVVPGSLMNRDFMQRERFIIDVGNLVVGTAVMLVLIELGHPVMGLAISRVGAQVLTMVLMLIMAPERYLPGFSWAHAKPLLAFGLPLAGSQLLIVGIANVDFIVVGHNMGAQQLGYYNLAFAISGWPVTIFTTILVSVTLPTLSRVRNSPTELTKHLRAGLSAVAAASFPVCALLSALAAPLIDTVYGKRWHEAYTALIVLGIFGAARSVLTLFSDLTIALGMTRRLLLIQLAWLAALTPAMIICVRLWGIVGAGVAHAIVIILVVTPAYIYTVRKSMSLGLRWVSESTVRPLIASVFAAAFGYGATQLVANEILQVLIGATVGLLVYLLLAGTWLIKVVATLRTMYWRQGAHPAGDEADAGESLEDIALVSTVESAMEVREGPLLLSQPPPPTLE